MDEIVNKKLLEIEAKENVRVIHAVESGSRAWGFASPDSDFDVRFIYIHQEASYLRLDPAPDVIEWQLNDTLDINGWDITKALRLLMKTNMTVYEWDASPIVYKTTDEWRRVRNELPQYFQTKPAAFHYLHTASHNYRDYIFGKESVRLKKYFYVLRPLLAAHYILREQKPAPMLFKDLLGSELEPELQRIVRLLVDKKMALPEIGESQRIDSIDRYIERQILSLEARTRALPSLPIKQWDKLNDLFRSLI